MNINEKISASVDINISTGIAINVKNINDVKDDDIYLVNETFDTCILDKSSVVHHLVDDVKLDNDIDKIYMVHLQQWHQEGWLLTAYESLRLNHKLKTICFIRPNGDIFAIVERTKPSAVLLSTAEYNGILFYLVEAVSGDHKYVISDHIDFERGFRVDPDAHTIKYNPEIDDIEVLLQHSTQVLNLPDRD